MPCHRQFRRSQERTSVAIGRLATVVNSVANRFSCSRVLFGILFFRTLASPFRDQHLQDPHIDDRHIDDQQMKFPFESLHLLAPFNQCLRKNFQLRIVRCTGCEKLYRSAWPAGCSIQSRHAHLKPQSHEALPKDFAENRFCDLADFVASSVSRLL